MQKGFTIIELLIVIVVIGILVAIGIMSYSGYQRRAYDASVQSDLESISGELEAYRARIDSSNPQQRFPANSSNLLTLEIQASKSSYSTTVSQNMIYCIQNNGTNAYQEFILIAMSKSGAIFQMTQDGFKANTFTSTDLSTGFCASQGMAVGSYGMTGGGWASWVRSS